MTNHCTTIQCLSSSVSSFLVKVELKPILSWNTPWMGHELRSIVALLPQCSGFYLVCVSISVFFRYSRQQVDELVKTWGVFLPFAQSFNLLNSALWDLKAGPIILSFSTKQQCNRQGYWEGWKRCETGVMANPQCTIKSSNSKQAGVKQNNIQCLKTANQKQKSREQGEGHIPDLSQSEGNSRPS